MPPYTGPSKERDTYSARFIRVEDNLYVGKPDDDSMTHRELAEFDGTLGRIQRLKAEKPREVDAGSIFVAGEEITVASHSWTLGVPDKIVKEEARSKTVTLFESESSGYTVYKSGI